MYSRNINSMLFRAYMSFNIIFIRLYRHFTQNRMINNKKKTCNMSCDNNVADNLL